VGKNIKNKWYPVAFFKESIVSISLKMYKCYIVNTLYFWYITNKNA